MANRQGTPIWYELITDDPDAAERFYGRILGWTFRRPPGGLDRDYRVAEMAGTGVGGLMKRPDGMAVSPRWQAYFGVDDVDASAAKLATLGGKVHFGPMDIPDVGRFAAVTDPQGAPFYLMRGFSDADSQAFAPASDGHALWNELVATDQAAALAFYGELLGWRKGDAMPMGEMGDYTFIHLGEPMIGAMMNGGGPNAVWRFYFRVPDIDRAAREAADGGGRIVQEPMEIPGGEYAFQIDDPEGARVGFVGPRKA